MADIANRISGLSPEKRAILEQKLALARERRTTATNPLVRVKSAPVPSFGQERLWFLEQIEGGTPLYNISVAIHLRGHLNIDAVRSALDSVVRRHDSLRTRYVSVHGVLKLVVDEDASINLSVANLSTLPGAEQPAALEAALKAEARHVFNLERDLLLRAALFRVTDDDHTLQLTLHHIASDGWSLGILYRDFSAYYNAAEKGEATIIPDLPVRYSDYAAWLRQTLQGAELERLTSYWTKRLQGSTHVLQLPTDHPRPPVQTFAGRQKTFFLGAKAALAVHEFCRREDATLFMVLLAAFYTLLNRHSSQPSILVGSPVAARPVAEVEDIIGFFTNTIILRGDLGDEPTFRDLVHRVKNSTIQAFDHQDVPFEKVIEQLSPERDRSRSPFFQVMFVLQNAPVHSLSLPGIAASIREIHTGTAKFDLTFSVEEVSDDVKVAIEYNTALFNVGTVESLWTHFSTFIQNAIGRPTESVATIPMLTDRERQKILFDWNTTEMDYPRDVTLAAVIEAQADRTPDSIALIFEGQSLSYRELNERANKLAHEIIGSGVGPNKTVGVCIERSLELLVALLAVVKSGGAYVPLDPSLPPQRLSNMMEDAELQILLVTSRTQDTIKGFRGGFVRLDDLGWTTNSPTNPIVKVGPDDLAYVIYTSGTTGKPKGVEIQRSAFLNFLHSMRTLPGISETDCLAAVTTISFDIAGLELFLPLIVGARIVIASHETAGDGHALQMLIEDSSATVLQATPITWRLLLEAGWKGNGTMKALCGGEAMPPELIEPLTRACGSVWNMYGPTETTVWSSVCEISPGTQSISIGKPIANTQMYVLNSHLQPVPVGASGALYIAGNGLAKGYRNRPDLTSDKFVADPFRPAQKMYQTGDLARYNADGTIECLGRSDHQVKIRGFRIELGEIEALLRQYPGVSQVVVIAREDAPGDKRLVAYLVVPAGNASPADLREYLKEKLPNYMVPSAFVFLDDLPLTANGKVDRKALPVPEATVSPVVSARMLPRTYIEKQLSEIWEEIFSIPQVGVEDDFFDIGGHSLTAVSMMGKIAQVFGKQLTLNTLFESPTIARLAKHLEGDQKRVGQHTLVSIQASGSKPPIYWIPGGAALGLFRLRHLVTRLGPEQPVYGLGSSHPQSLSDVETVEQRASNYLKLIKQVQPDGPYCIAGFCAGGRVAYEIAQRIIAGGEPVAFLGMINCWYPNYPVGRLNALRTKVQRLQYQVLTARANGTSVVGYVKAKISDRRTAQSKVKGLVEARRQVEQGGFKKTDRVQNDLLLEATIRKFDEYEPHPYKGRISLFISDDEAAAGVSRDLDPRFAWARYAAEYEIREFPGGHEAVLEMPYAVTFAETLSSALEDALRLHWA